MSTRCLLWLVPALAALGAAPASASEVVLHSFRCPLKGANPESGLIRDSAGNFYGTANNGGTANQGVVYKLDPHGQETVIYNFTGGTDGGNPSSGLIRDLAGNLYRTTPVGGTAGAGVVYKVDTIGHQTVLYSFTGGPDGNSPIGGVIRDSLGSLYGTTYAGGNAGAGVVYKLDSTGHETVLYSFGGGTDGYRPFAAVISRLGRESLRNDERRRRV